MASTDELAEAYADWRQRCNDNARLQKMTRGWDRVLHFTTTDTDVAFTVAIAASTLGEFTLGHAGQPDIVVSASSEDFCDMFWGDLNPSEKYMAGEISYAGSQEDVMRIDAISMVAFLDN